ncbi:hypothetical protein [Selenomonas dianae]|uniref:Uncharacterized protein n=1 Tax=Selenomonas dianae TaxID=135079 RepID=A0ABN0SY55_9FIRM|nr:hypothetical protein [Selenomonas dianae]WLD81396.1 hypothetical protein QU667_05975 [Selenomonas dianae]
MIESTMNVDEVKSLFRSEAVAFEYRAGVPLTRATSLFNREAVEYAMTRITGEYGVTYGKYGIGEIQMPYLTEYGFLVAATYHNVEILHGNSCRK